MPLESFENVTVHSKANVYFDGRCVSHAFVLANVGTVSLRVLVRIAVDYGLASSDVYRAN
jgi:uncharacterized protein YaiE (UPF0345 family)